MADAVDAYVFGKKAVMDAVRYPGGVVQSALAASTLYHHATDGDKKDWAYGLLKGLVDSDEQERVSIASQELWSLSCMRPAHPLLISRTKRFALSRIPTRASLMPSCSASVGSTVYSAESPRRDVATASETTVILLGIMFLFSLKRNRTRIVSLDKTNPIFQPAHQCQTRSTVPRWLQSPGS